MAHFRQEMLCELALVGFHLAMTDGSVCHCKLTVRNGLPPKAPHGPMDTLSMHGHVEKATSCSRALHQDGILRGGAKNSPTAVVDQTEPFL